MATIPNHAHQFTSEEEMKSYYDHLRYWRTCVVNTNEVIVPTQEEAKEYLVMLLDKNFNRFGSKAFRKYEERYDWRPQKFEEDGCVGLRTPTGEVLLPPIFSDAFNQFRAVPSVPDFIPVYNGKAWALASTGERPVIVTDFCYRCIMPERWDGIIYFVQDADTGKWGALSSIVPITNNRQPLRSREAISVTELLPPVADSIYEDHLYTDCAPTTFWITRKGDKIGLLTPFTATEIIYNSYKCDPDEVWIDLTTDDGKTCRVTEF